MPTKTIVAIGLSLSGLVALSSVALAKSSDLAAFNTTYGTEGTRLDTCDVCHGSSFALNGYGQDYRDALNANGGNESAALTAIAELDSDGDGFSNILEIVARTFPGDPADAPTPPPVPTPTPLPTAPPPPPTLPPPTPTAPTEPPPQPTQPPPSPPVPPEPSPTPIGVPDTSADLVRRKAWVEPKRYDPKANPQTPLTFIGKVENLGTGVTTVIVRFQVVDRATGITVTELATEATALQPGEMKDLSVIWENPPAGEFEVLAQAWCDSDDDGLPDTPGQSVKTFKARVLG